MFIKTADGSYINSNQVQSFTIEEDTDDGTFFISANLNEDYDAYWLAEFDTKDKAQTCLDDLINTINRGGGMNINLPPDSTFYAECKRLEEH